MRSTDQNGAGEYEQTPGSSLQKVSIVPHWNAILGLVAIGVLYAFLPTKVSIGPSWTLLAVETVSLLPFVLTTVSRRGVSPVRRRVGSVILLVIVTLTLTVGIGHLILPLKRDVNGIGLIYSGLLLYGCNVLMFGLWYWEIDGGGPEQRRQSDHEAVDFLFPQQVGSNNGNWAPQFFDYLYVAFTGATAFSPTDTLPMSHRAKLLMMLEAILALIIISFVVSRAINLI